LDLYRFSERDYAETRTGGTAGISQRLYRINTLTYRYRYDVVEYEEEGDERVAKIGRIETTFHRDTRDNPLNPKRGWSHGLTLEYANPRLRGAETFARFTLNNMYYSQVSRNIVLALGVRAGYAWGLSSTKGVLRPEQFNLSDYNTPRGYKWKTEHTDNMMLNLSMEIRFPVYKWMDAAVFFDSGGLYDEFSSFDIHSMYSSIGLGLRFITPIGPVRLDYGYPVRGDGNRNYWPHVAFGHAF
jgi:outer membrane protein insertion porin family